MKKDMKKYIGRACAALCALVIVSALTAIAVNGIDDSGIYEKTVRLHVVANSDGERDQSLKLLVRNALLDVMEERLGDAVDADEARDKIASMIPELETVALQTLAASGDDSGVVITLSREYYPTKEYDGFSLPAGKYDSLRVVIGDGDGQNWWCVLYPPLCLSAATSPEEKLTQAGFTPGQVGVITGNDSGEYKVRFKILEVFSELWESIFG